jgi:hypothetical protein
MARPEVTGKKTSSPLGKLLIDRRAYRLIDVDFHPEERLNTKELAAWLDVSVQFLEIGRTRGYGPKFERITDKLIRYRVGDVLEWLKSRTHASTAEYRSEAL